LTTPRRAKLREGVLAFVEWADGPNPDMAVTGALADALVEAA